MWIRRPNVQLLHMMNGATEKAITDSTSYFSRLTLNAGSGNYGTYQAHNGAAQVAVHDAQGLDDRFWKGERYRARRLRKLAWTPTPLNYGFH